VRCYFMRKGQFVAVEVLTDASDTAAVKQAEEQFTNRSEESFSGFEVWDRARLVHRHPQSLPKYA
jgi:hypothetical protein